MEELRLADVAACVVGWHNRHPLARRIGASHVHAVGYVALPFSGGGATGAVADAAAEPEAEAGGTLRERAEKRARQAQEPPVVLELALDRKTLKPAFTEDFIDPLSPRDVARFARTHAQALARPPADGPLRAVRAEGDAPLTLYLMTAVVETGTRKSRVLIGGGPKPQVLGRRVLQPQRVALGALPLVLLAAGGIAFAPRDVEPAPVLASATAASAAVVPPAAATSAAVAPPLAAASGPAEAPALPASASAPPEPPGPPASAALAVASVASAPAADDGTPHLGRIQMPSIKPRLNARAAAAEAAASAAAALATADSPATMPPQAPAAPRVPASAAAPPPPPPAFALSTRPLRTRAEADQTRVAMKSLLAAIDARGVQVDVLPEGDDWRVVGMPFGSRNEADKARALLVSRGMKVQVVGF